MELTAARRVRFMMVLVAFLAVASVVRLFRRDLRYYPNFDQTLVARSERGLEPIRHHFAGETVVGFATDYPVFEGMIEGDASYYMAQYGMVPVLVDARNTHEWVMGRFLSPEPRTRFEEKGLWRVWREYERGFIIYRREER